MTYEHFQRESTWLREVLLDAQERGDIYLEYNVKEKLTKLETQYYEKDSE